MMFWARKKAIGTAANMFGSATRWTVLSRFPTASRPALLVWPWFGTVSQYSALFMTPLWSGYAWLKRGKGRF